MKVVALLSGGKDSCYSILKSRMHGHDVVAIAHITPPKEEADSYMYQSVGSNAVPYLATSLGLPLFSRATKARATQQQLFYTPTENDEVEDLVALLQTVKRECPQVQAVCSGALWSDYQRLRVESAVSRVGLLSLSYLWHRNQRELLDEMIDVGIDAVLVKVAGVGLNSKHLGKSLKEMRPTLHELEEKYGSYVCGEGGEFESLVLWMPGFEKRLVLVDTEIVSHSDDPYAPVSYLRINSCSLEELTEEQMQVATPQSVVAPEVFHPSVNWSELIQNCDANKKRINHDSFQEGLTKSAALSLNVSVGSGNKFLFVSIQSPEDGKKGVVEAATQLKRVLENHNESLASVVYVTLSLRSVTGTSYKDANAGYNELFAVPECTPPPSRACVAVSPENHATTLEALVRRKRERNAPGAFTLHVQSLSEWAPPCIGPYAQFVEEDGVVHVSGILPLYAPTATVPEQFEGRGQVVASVYNLEKTLEASHSNLQKMGLFIAYTTKDCLVEPIHDELKLELNKRGAQEAVIIVLPISALPKGALVEVRAIGVVDESDLQFPGREKGVGYSEHTACRRVVCGSLGFAVCSRDQDTSIDDLNCTLDSVLDHWFETRGRLISVQLYYSKEFCVDDMKAILETRASGAAITLTKCHEACGSASTRCITVYDLSSSSSSSSCSS